ncbi:LPXTG-domain-containing protein [Colletotrichum graminicola]|uniref:LPXTG-domain-containing protein n=1 Tax=Colletotrichum graminicola (strain M1.001 / M2 / FGSC 10212) TaxID=645133 RepID=E3QAQ3_COLGM|nr:LPXTG-domain-containing protein [Colletotrichum graminicola M1.001]EFQ27941.1 LPXTG-domain-containing protein [Colletotrichum graminicola M1.001]WDK12133.1 LPXTG-domain-containing protein [Colletotrichum graminicola]
MTARSALVLLTIVVPAYVSALQVTPNSPCASFCLDSNGLDISDPNSSNTKGKDITCTDGEYQTGAAGQKFQQCMSCLQDSSLVQGTENDQDWFLYNMRYSFDYCIFGYPNATGVGSSPCTTSTACGALEKALTDGELDPEKSSQYSYCDADGGAMLGSAYDKCLSCVRAGGEHYYLANYLIALEAGCRQRPDPGTLVSLNSTVFTKGTITAADPKDAAKLAKDATPALPMTAIVGIVIGAVVTFLFVAGCTFIQWRKRKARREGRGINPDLFRRAKGHRPVSSLSFRCQTHLTPKTPNFFSVEEEDMHGEKLRHHHEAQNQQQKQDMASSPVSKPSLWMPHNSISSLHDATPVPYTDRKPTQKEILPLASITTSLPAIPVKAHSPRFNSSSPQDDYYATPTSTTSAAPLLPFRQYVPSEHGSPTPPTGHAAVFSPASTYASPTSGTTASPLLSQGGWPAPTTTHTRHAAPAEPSLSFSFSSPSPPVGDAARTIPSITRDLPRPLPKRITSLGGSPVETSTIQTTFPPPPPPPKRR